MLGKSQVKKRNSARQQAECKPIKRLVWEKLLGVATCQNSIFLMTSLSGLIEDNSKEITLSKTKKQTKLPNRTKTKLTSSHRAWKSSGKILLPLPSRGQPLVFYFIYHYPIATIYPLSQPKTGAMQWFLV